LFDHLPRAPLSNQERPARIDGERAIPIRERLVEERGWKQDTGSADDDVELTEHSDGLPNELVDGSLVGDVDGVRRMSLWASELQTTSLDLFDVDIRKAQRCAELCKHLGTARADPLRGADQERSLPVEPEGAT
jgi:hypothetical protein